MPTLDDYNKLEKELKQYKDSLVSLHDTAAGVYDYLENIKGKLIDISKENNKGDDKIAEQFLEISSLKMAIVRLEHENKTLQRDIDKNSKLQSKYEQLNREYNNLDRATNTLLDSKNGLVREKNILANKLTEYETRLKRMRFLNTFLVMLFIILLIVT